MKKGPTILLVSAGTISILTSYWLGEKHVMLSQCLNT